MLLPRVPGHTCPAIDRALRAVRKGDRDGAVEALEAVRAENSAMRRAYNAALAALDEAGVPYTRDLPMP